MDMVVFCSHFIFRGLDSRPWQFADFGGTELPLFMWHSDAQAQGCLSFSDTAN